MKTRNQILIEFEKKFSYDNIGDYSVLVSKLTCAPATMLEIENFFDIAMKENEDEILADLEELGKILKNGK